MFTTETQRHREGKNEIRFVFSVPLCLCGKYFCMKSKTLEHGIPTEE